MKEISFLRAITAALYEELEHDSSVVILGENIGAGGGTFGATHGLLEHFGSARVKDTPISESAIVGMALGMAITGLRPVVEIMFMDFITTCMDPIVNGIAKSRYMYGGQFKIPLTIRTAFGAGGSAGPQHSQSLEAWFAHVPGLKVVMPSNPFDAKGLLKSSIRDDNPVLFMEHKRIYQMKGEVPENEYEIALGKAEVKREGYDVTIVATAQMVNEAMKASMQLADEGISTEIIDPRTIAPLDKQTILTSVQKTSRLVVVHEAVKTCGFGAEIAAFVMEDAFGYLDAPVQRVGAAFAPVPFSKSMEQFCLPQADDIIAAVRKVVT